MSVDGPRSGSRRSRTEAGESNDNLHNTNTQNVSGSNVHRASGRKVDLGTRSAGKNIHESRNKHATQTTNLTLNFPSPSSRSISSKSRGKRQYKDSAGSENELSQDEYRDDSSFGPQGQANGVANAPPHCLGDCKKRQRQDTERIANLTWHTEDLESKLRETEKQLREEKAALSDMTEQLNDINRRLHEAREQLVEQNAIIQKHTERIESYNRIKRAAKDLQEANEKLYELDRKDDEGEKQIRKLEETNEKLWRERQDLRITVQLFEREKAEQEVSSLLNRIPRIKDKKRKVIFDLANSKDQIPDSKARAKKDRERERERERLSIEEEKCEVDLTIAKTHLSRIDEILTTLKTQLQQANYRSFLEQPVSPGERSDSGYGTGAFSSASAASPARSISIFSSNDDPYEIRSLGSCGRREHTISARAGPPSVEYDRRFKGSSYSSSTSKLANLHPPPAVPMAPTAGEMLETASSRERKQHSHPVRY